jgi:hypothetical protein
MTVRTAVTLVLDSFVLSILADLSMPGGVGRQLSAAMRGRQACGRNRAGRDRQGGMVQMRRLTMRTGVYIQKEERKVACVEA